MTAEPAPTTTPHRSMSFGGLYAGAGASFGRTIGTHLGFAGVWFSAFVAGYLMLGCCMTAPLVMFVGAGSLDPASTDAGTLAGLAVMYFAFVLFVICAFSFHQSATLHLAMHDLRGRPVSVADAIRGASATMVPQSALAVLRTVVDFAVFGAVLGVPLALVSDLPSPVASSDAGATAARFEEMALILGAGYLVAMFGLGATRGCLGLAACVVQTEGLGPLAALRRSFALLRGHRLRFIATKAVLWLVAMVVFLAVIALMTQTVSSVIDDGAGPAVNPLAILVMLPVMFAMYVFMLLVYAFDHVLDAVAYEALRAPVPLGEALAQVFR